MTINKKQTSPNINRFVTFILLFVFWLFLSGHYDFFHLSLGIICCALVAFLSHDLLFEKQLSKNTFKIGMRFIRYLPWLIYQIILANIHVAYLVIHPKKPIDPKIIKFKTKLKSDISKVILANSITLTPGTITMDIEEDEFYVHAISKKTASDLMSGEMENRVAHIFQEDK